jgi:phosphatidylserine decarboxylase
VKLELAWGWFRRGWLRRIHPGYVRRMAEKRQGHCPDCSHDIIDSRDLKYWRNVCGFSFRPEDDSFRWRDHLRLARYGLAEVVGMSVLLLPLAIVLAALAAWSSALLAVPLAVVLGLWAFLVSFFRDPERTISPSPDALLSPADGRITSVGEVEVPDFPGGRAFRIVIFLSPFNVHINRVPRSGRVVGLQYFRGGFCYARRGDSDRFNEQYWLDLEEPRGRRVRIKQVSGAVARRIVCWLRLGEEVRAGERFGMIKLGSRTDVLIPLGEPFEPLVKVGDRVKGGTTVLLRFRSAVSEKN